uniref:Zinc ribbon domain-containing protein n=1 Tax=Thermodesulfobacterium geofontis TaxID=1295609 RepID=A0A7V4JQI4_9BACT
MPIYEYECKNCGKHFEVWQKITDEPLKICKECRGELIKLISESNFILKGTGWYVTDYARKEKEKKEKQKKENTSSENSS